MPALPDQAWPAHDQPWPPVTSPTPSPLAASPRAVPGGWPGSGPILPPAAIPVPTTSRALPLVVPAAPLPPRAHALTGRFTVSLAGLLASGMVLLGLALLALMLLVPGAGGTGLDAATGPGWPRTVAHLAVGVLGEIGWQLSRRASWPLRVGASVLISASALAVLAVGWWV